VTRNPPWEKEELILALDLYFRVSPSHTNDKNPEIVSLSNFLQELPLFSETDKQSHFRSPNSIYMKLCNFLTLDPSYKGKGLSSHSKLDKEIWDAYFQRRDELKSIAKLLRESPNYSKQIRYDLENIKVADKPFFEGSVIFSMHRLHERNKSIVDKKKQNIFDIKHKLSCEACDFDFYSYYGEIGRGFIECHHNIPISKLKMEHEVKLSDLSLICSNCHSIVHIIRPWIMVDQLREILCRRNKLYSKFF
jgi:5-methylcytosine-specific restriction enzyme A